MDIPAWLSELGLEGYAEAFRNNDIDARILHTLSADDLRELGVSSLGHRKKLLDAIAQLRAADRTVGTGQFRHAATEILGRAASADGDVLRSGGFDGARGAT